MAHSTATVYDHTRGSNGHGHSHSHGTRHTDGQGKQTPQTLRCDKEAGVGQWIHNDNRTASTRRKARKPASRDAAGPLVGSRKASRAGAQGSPSPSPLPTVTTQFSGRLTST